MTKLLLAVDIADAVLEADRDERALDVPATAARLLEEHPEARASFDEVAAALADAGPPDSCC